MNIMITMILLLFLVDLIPKSILLLFSSHEGEVPCRLPMLPYTTPRYNLILTQIIVTPIVRIRVLSLGF